MWQLVVPHWDGYGGSVNPKRWVLRDDREERAAQGRCAGSQPRGYTCLHFACDGSDKQLTRNVRTRGDAKDNTPLHLASGVGVNDIVRVLVEARADVNVTNSLKKGGWQKALGSSSETTLALRQASAPKILFH